MTDRCWVVGLDLSLTAAGMADLFDGEWYLDVTRSTGKKTDNLLQRSNRLGEMCGQVLGTVCRDGDNYPDLVVVESPSYGSQHGSPHDRSGLWWLVVNTLHELGIAVATVSPQGRAKYGTSKGNADKQAVFNAVVNRYSTEPFADLARLGWKRGNDMADAALLAAMGARHLGQPVDGDLPQACLDAMAGAAWPTEAVAA